MQLSAANPANHGLSYEWLLPLITPNVLGNPVNGTYTPPRGFHPTVLNDYGEVASGYAGLATLRARARSAVCYSASSARDCPGAHTLQPSHLRRSARLARYDPTDSSSGNQPSSAAASLLGPGRLHRRGADTRSGNSWSAAALHTSGASSRDCRRCRDLRGTPAGLPARSAGDGAADCPLADNGSRSVSCLSQMAGRGGSHGARIHRSRCRDVPLQPIDKTGRYLSSNRRDQKTSASRKAVSDRRAGLVISPRHAGLLRHRRHQDHRSDSARELHAPHEGVPQRRSSVLRPAPSRRLTTIPRLPQHQVYLRSTRPVTHRSAIHGGLPRIGRRPPGEYSRPAALLSRPTFHGAAILR
jgi:hypothetical protein